MGSFFGELAKTLAQRWVALLALPGLAFIAAVGMAGLLGHRHAVDWDLLAARGTGIAASATGQGPVKQGMAVIVVLVLAALAALLVQSLSGALQRLWLGVWPRPESRWAAQRVVRRRTAWRGHVATRQTLQDAHDLDPAPDQGARIAAAARAANGIALSEPARATWMGDRVHAVAAVAHSRYGLDLEFGWSRLWLVMPEGSRTEIRAANDAFASAVVVSTWGALYVLVGLVWWPAAVAGVGVYVTGWVRGRSAVADLGALSEAALDVHGRALARALGVDSGGGQGPLSVTEGRAVSSLVRKGR